MKMRNSPHCVATIGRHRGVSDQGIEAGQDWKRSIGENLETAEIILLLISPDFLTEANRGPHAAPVAAGRLGPWRLRRTRALGADDRSIAPWDLLS